MASILNVDQINNAAGTSGIALDASTGKASFPNSVTIPNGATMPAGSVLQVVQTSTDATSAVSTATYTSVGLDVNITPTSSSSKILITVCGSFGNSQDTYGGTRLYRGATEIGGTSNVGNRNGYAFPINERSVDGPWEAYMASYTFLDSPATTSQITYSLKVAKHYGTSIMVNRSYNDVDASYGWRSRSSIVVMEIAQ